jgi:hypothetical protein
LHAPRNLRLSDVYWQIFASLAYNISAERPFEDFKVTLARHHENYRFPADAEFVENFETKEPTDTSSYSIEYIMPQKDRLRSEWREWRRMKGRAEDMAPPARKPDPHRLQHQIF